MSRKGPCRQGLSRGGQRKWGRSQECQNCSWDVLQVCIFLSMSSLTTRRTDVVRRNIRCLAARNQKILSIPSLLLRVSSAQGRVTSLQLVRKTKRRVYIPTEEAVSSVARKRILQKTANFGRKMSQGQPRQRFSALGAKLVQMKMTSILSSERMRKCRKTRRRKTGGENGST